MWHNGVVASRTAEPCAMRQAIDDHYLLLHSTLYLNVYGAPCSTEPLCSLTLSKLLTVRVIGLGMKGNALSRSCLTSACHDIVKVVSALDQSRALIVCRLCCCE